MIWNVSFLVLVYTHERRISTSTRRIARRVEPIENGKIRKYESGRGRGFEFLDRLITITVPVT